MLTPQQMDNIMVRDLTTHLQEPKLMVLQVQMPMGIRIGVEIYQRLKQRNPPLKIRILMLIVLLDTMLSDAHLDKVHSVKYDWEPI